MMKRLFSKLKPYKFDLSLPSNILVTNHENQEIQFVESSNLSDPEFHRIENMIQTQVDPLIFVKELNEMEQKSEIPLRYTFFTMIFKYLVTKGDEESLLEEKKRMIRLNLQPNLFIFNMLLVFYCERNDEVKLEGILNEMKTAGVRANVSTYQILIKYYFEHQKWSNVIAMVEHMESRGLSSSNLQLYYLDSLVNVNDGVSANRIFATIESPCKWALSCMIRLYHTNNDSELMMKLVQEYENIPMTMYEMIFETIPQSAIDECYKLMLSRQIVADSQVFRAILKRDISYLDKAQCILNQSEFLAIKRDFAYQESPYSELEMKLETSAKRILEGHVNDPDAIARVLNGYLVAKRDDLFHNFVNLVEERKFLKTPYWYENLLDGYRKQSNDEMLEKTILKIPAEMITNYSFRVAVDLYGRKKDFPKVLELYESYVDMYMDVTYNRSRILKIFLSFVMAGCKCEKPMWLRQIYHQHKGKELNQNVYEIYFYYFSEKFHNINFLKELMDDVSDNIADPLPELRKLMNNVANELVIAETTGRFKGMEILKKKTPK